MIPGGINSMIEKLVKLNDVIDELINLYKKGSIKLTEMQEFLDNLNNDSV